MSFAQLGVPRSIRRALTRRGIEEPFEIQAVTIGDALAGRDVCGRAPTGSGKTLAFGIPLVATVDRAEPRFPRGLVLAPTRELAGQIATELASLSADVRVSVVYGGVGYAKQEKALRRGVEILVACPGRLEDLIDRGAVSLGEVDRVVIDEADRMVDMGFLPVVRRILDQTADDRQTILFSATLDGEVAKLSRRYQTDPVTHEVGETVPDITAADHRFVAVEREDRIATTVDVITESGRTIVFCRTRRGSDRLAEQLAKRGVEVVAIHGGHAQNRRLRALRRFTDGDVAALVATDVAARGIHVDDVDAVVHYDPPDDHTTYIHRSGRTARAGRSGVVVSLVQPDQEAEATRLQRELRLGSAVGGTGRDRLPDGQGGKGTGADGATSRPSSRRRSRKRSRRSAAPRRRETSGRS